MAATDDFEQLEAFLASREFDVTIALATFDSGAAHPILRSLSITERVANGFRDLVSSRASDLAKLRQRNDLLVIPYDADRKAERHEIEFLELDDSDYLSGVVHSVPSPSQIPLIGDVAGYLESVRFYALIATRGNRRAVLFRRYGRSKFLQRSGNLLIRLVGDRLERIEEPAFQFAPDFDAIHFRDHLFVLNKENLHHIFRYHEHLQATAQASLEVIRARVPIVNFDEFARSCMAHQSKLEKLRSISRKAYLQTVTIGDILQTIREFQLNVQVDGEGAGASLVFDPRQRWVILHLLDDSFLGSQMTGLRYEANSKRQL